MRKLLRENTLAVRNPEVAAQWHPTRNGSLSPNDVSYGSSKKAWWICKEGHEWDASISNRTSGKGCWICGRKITGKKNRLSEKQFLLRCRKMHGNRYDYSKTSYTTSKSKITVICAVHGEFEQIANEHMIGRGCAKCYGRGLTGDEFILEARKLHGEKFDYSLVKYKGKSSPIRIVCPKHGEFEQSPKAHLRGHGCNECGAEIRKSKKTFTTEKFIELARAKHGDKYDYSESRYTKAIKKIAIICPKHGEFEQKAIEHTTGSGCPDCGIEASRDQKKISKEEFIRRANEVHGDQYDYAKVEMSQAADEVIIICPAHGEFRQTGYSHLDGKGCKNCGGWLTQEQFLEKSLAVHGDKYDYSKSVYVSTTNKVTVICTTHGEFEQNAGKHMRGAGCPDCAEYGFDEAIPAIVYYLKIDRYNQKPLYKIGVTNRTVKERYSFAEDFSRIKILATWQHTLGRDARNQEREILSRFKTERYTGPDILASGNTKLFRKDILGLDVGFPP